MGGGSSHRVFTDRVRNFSCIRPKRSEESLGLRPNYSDAWFKRWRRLGPGDASRRTIQKDETQLTFVLGAGALRFLEKRWGRGSAG